MTIVKKDKMKILFIYIFLFAYIYSPQWVGGQYHLLFSSYYWGWICFAFVLSFAVFNKEFRTFFKNPLYLKYILCIAFAALYYLFVYSIFTNDFIFTKTRIIQNCYPIVSLVNLTFIVFLLKKMGYSKEKGICVFLNLAAIQGVFCFLMLFIPSLKSVANNLFINSSSFKEGDYILSSRIYGIASDYTYAFPISHGLLCGISLYFGFKGNKKYIYVTFLILLSVLLNGRTGLLVALISMFLACIISIKNGRHPLSIFAFIVFTPLLAVFVIYQLQDSLPEVYNFVFGLFRQINEKSGTVEYLFKTNLYFPDGLWFVFGEGHMVFSTEDVAQFGYAATDIGFVNDMFMGGLVYVFIRYFAVAIIIFANTKRKSYLDRILSTMALVMWILATIKGQSTANSMLIATLQLLFIIKQMLPEEGIYRRKKYGYRLLQLNSSSCFSCHERLQRE